MRKSKCWVNYIVVWQNDFSSQKGKVEVSSKLCCSLVKVIFRAKKVKSKCWVNRIGVRQKWIFKLKGESLSVEQVVLQFGKSEISSQKVKSKCWANCVEKINKSIINKWKPKILEKLRKSVYLSSMLDISTKNIQSINKKYK